MPKRNRTSPQKFALVKNGFEKFNKFHMTAPC